MVALLVVLMMAVFPQPTEMPDSHVQFACSATNNTAEKLVCSTTGLPRDGDVLCQWCHTMAGVGKRLTWHEPAGGHKGRQVPCSLLHPWDQHLDDLLWLNEGGDGMQPHVHHHHTFPGVIRLRTCRHYYEL